MDELRYTLLSEGSSDRALIPILTWLLVNNGVETPIDSTWSDLRQLSSPPRSLDKKIAKSLFLYPCDLLFVHRDADRTPYDVRKQEIMMALSMVTEKPPSVCVIPVRMQEAWLLIDEDGIRRAASNPSGRNPLHLPLLRDLENIPDPKSQLHHLLRDASGLSGRHLKRFKFQTAAQLVAEFVGDFSPLRQLSAFAALEADIQHLIDDQGWR